MTAQSEPPIFLIIGGPNGSGKSTAYQESVVALGTRAFRIINPDLFAKRIAELENLDSGTANIEAVQRIEAWLDTSILAGHTVGVETVLSTEKYRRLVSRAKSIGYLFQLIYVILPSPELNLERVRLRVSRGGHPVPEDKIIARYHRSLAQLPWFLEQADSAIVYDNGGSEPRVVGKKQNGRVSLDRGAPRALLAALGVKTS